MKKLTLAFCLSIAALTLTGCGKSSQSGQVSSSSSIASSTVSTSQQTHSSSITSSTDDSLNPDKLTPAENAALVMYYRDAHMPGSKENDYSADMGNAGQGATVKIYNKDNVPKGDGPLYKNYPNGAQLLYSVKLNNGRQDGGHLDSAYYTIANNKVYYEDTDAGISAEGATPAEMVDYANSHDGVKRILNVARQTKIVDMRGKGSSAQGSTNSDSKNLTPQQLGTLVALNQAPDWFKEYLSDGTMYYGNQQEMKVGPAGFDYITAYGDSTSYIYFKRDGNNVTIKQVDGTDKPMVTKHVTVSGLIRDYYTNQSQKDEVNGYVDELKPISDVAHNN
ncbi:hypothetical protein H5S09_06345 [Limosilactobacillus sp. STM2_1]|uniref:Lreu-0056-like domain-containing protein n=1 Tax=Limosilactobacillus rudii TaxID=2759755 RepID=A0A7W3UL37_9LACO|nr:hypothetical protein [Limosilactobacillus rudii]MBB1079511.1 hypothetical protein [Limosilactobacillus rudii]MBB1097557.1 hypothetical protein [Limosilactobacillus rudii]MCD7134666.1 hypothetical protein [Limosilactobacillus rudii]